MWYFQGMPKRAYPALCNSALFETLTPITSTWTLFLLRETTAVTAQFNFSYVWHLFISFLLFSSFPLSFPITLFLYSFPFTSYPWPSSGLSLFLSPQIISLPYFPIPSSPFRLLFLLPLSFSFSSFLFLLFFLTFHFPFPPSLCSPLRFLPLLPFNFPLS